MAEPKHLTRARMQVARASRRSASQAELDAARAQYATAKIDACIRESSIKGGRLSDAQVAHLCGLILAEAGVNYDALQLIEPTLRAAVVRAQGGAQ